MSGKNKYLDVKVNEGIMNHGVAPPPAIFDKIHTTNEVRPSIINRGGISIVRHLSKDVLGDEVLVSALNNLLYRGFESKTDIKELLNENQYIYIASIEGPQDFQNGTSPLKIVGYVFASYSKYIIDNVERWGLYVGRIQVDVDCHDAKIGRRMSDNIVRDAYDWQSQTGVKVFVWLKTFTPFVYLLGQGICKGKLQPVGTERGIKFDDESQKLTKAVIGDVLSAVNSKIRHESSKLKIDSDFPFLIRNVAVSGIAASKNELKRIGQMLNLLPDYHVFKAAKMNVQNVDLMICVCPQLPPLPIVSSL